jgi:hypothetical protein
MDGAHFFERAPVVSWSTWLYRKVFQVKELPKRLESDWLSIPVPSPTGISPRRMISERASEYSAWYRSTFTPPSSRGELWIPPPILESHLSTKDWLGVELRDCDGTLVGCIVCQYAGELLNTKAGLVTWLCVAPKWRKRGVSNCLLRSIVKASYPRMIFFWRNDGWLSSPCPPIFTESRMVRSRKTSVVQSKRQQRVSISLEPIPLTLERRQRFMDAWKRLQPHGFILKDDIFQTSQFELYEGQGSQGQCIWILLQPTYERSRQDGSNWCEVLAWASVGRPCSKYEVAHYVEDILNRIPYTQIDAPTELPHLDVGWSSIGISSWSVLGLDPGTSQTPILPLCSA